MSVEYTFEYKEYDGRELYYILENGMKVVDPWEDTYMALYIDRRSREYNVVALKNAKDEELVLNTLIEMMVDYLDVDTSYRVCTFCSTEDDRYYGYEIRDRIWNQENK